MASFGEPKGIPHYPCPMCGTPVYSSALHCPTCGTDLTRAGAVLSSSGTSVEWKRKRRPGVWAALIVLTTAGVAAGTVGRPWLEQFAAPGVAVAKAAAQSALRSVRQRVARSADKVVTADKTRPTKARTPAAKPRTPIAATTVPARSRATLTISSTPRGARVQINGVARGVTPVTLNELRAGLYQVRISHQGYRSVTRAVALQAGRSQVVGITLPPQAPPRVATPVEKPAPARPQRAPLLEVGLDAPHFVAKDRIGLLYRPADFRGRRLLLVFVQTLNGDAQRVLRELNALHAGGGRGAAVVIVLHPDRASIRQFTKSEQIRIPVLFGTPTVARAYGVGSQPAVLYLVSEEGRVVLRQVGRINPGSALN